MLKILNKPLLKEWTTAQVTNPSRSFPGCRRTIITAPSAFVYRNATFPSLSQARIRNTCYSTVPSPVVKTKPVIPPPSNAAATRKPKVDLRPAPKKAVQEPRGGIHPPPPPTPTVHENPVSSTSTSTPTTASTLSTVPSPGALETTKHDIAEATKHGILEPPPEDASRAGRIWHQVKQLFWFYWGGLKLIFITHRQHAAAIRRREAEARARGEEAGLSRWEAKFLRTYDRDLVKLVPFVLTLLVLEEALPFIVLYAPGLLPSTCLLPSQRQRIEAKRRAKQMAHVSYAKAELQRFTTRGQDVASSSSWGDQSIESLDVDLTRAVAGMFSLPTWGSAFLHRRRIRKHLASLSMDDALLVKEDLGSRLKDEELVEALEERGLWVPQFWITPDLSRRFYTFSITDSQAPYHMREKLRWWLNGATDDKARLGLVLQVAFTESVKR